MSLGRGPFRAGGDRDVDRLRMRGASRRGDGERDCGGRLREKASGSTSPGSGDGRRTADCTAEAIFATPGGYVISQSYGPDYGQCRPGSKAMYQAMLKSKVTSKL